MNETREALHLTPYTSFDQLTSDPGTLAGLEKTFSSVDQVDLWTGGLSEHHMPGAMIGETFGLIIAHQFEALRSGDQFYYEKALDPAEVAMVKATSLSDIIQRDTNTDVMQADAFLTTSRHLSSVAARDSNAPQLIIGDTKKIAGGTASDTIEVNDAKKVSGGGGNDTFVFDFGKMENTTITDFHAGDLLEIKGVDPAQVSFADVHIDKVNPAMTDLTIGQDHIKLLGVSHVSASDFLFHV